LINWSADFRVCVAISFAEKQSSEANALMLLPLLFKRRDRDARLLGDRAQPRVVRGFLVVEPVDRLGVLIQIRPAARPACILIRRVRNESGEECNGDKCCG
jgi:hypothetical protein